MPLKRSPISFVNQSRRFKRRTLNFRWLPLLLLLLTVFLLNRFFLIRRIQCTIDDQPCDSEITLRFQKYLDTSVLLVNQKQLKNNIKDTLPVDDISFGFQVFNTFKISLSGVHPPIYAEVYSVQTLPSVSLDTSLIASGSATWPKPSSEISLFIQLASSSAYGLWDTGLISPVSTGTASFKYLVSEKPSPEVVKSIYKLIKITNKYLTPENIYIVGYRAFLSQSGQPDIIVSVPFDETVVVEAFKSLTYLVSIKKDAQVIDLRFKNPIIR